MRRFVVTATYSCMCSVFKAHTEISCGEKET